MPILNNYKPNSTNKIFRVRELLILSLQDLFSNRVGFTFSGNEDKENQIWILDEENDSTENNQCFPRVVIQRQDTQFQGIVGIGHGSPADYSWDSPHTIMKEGLVHNFSVLVKSYSFSTCEILAFTISWFFKFMEVNVISYDVARALQGIKCAGFGRVERTSEATEKKPIYACRIPLLIYDCDIIDLEDKTEYPEFSCIQVRTSFNCEPEEEEVSVVCGCGS